MLVSIPNQAFRLIPLLSGRNSEHDNEDTHLLGGHHSLPEILVTSKEKDRSRCPFSGQDHQVANDQGIDTLLLGPDKPTQP